MGIDIKRALGVNAFNSNLSINPIRFGLGNYESSDSFEKKSVSRFTSENYIKNAIATNPKIREIMNEINAPIKLNMQELNELLENHAKTTQIIAAGIIDNLPAALKMHVDTKAVKDAAYLHDIGKVLIPEEILNKKGKLTPAEKSIMHRHSELGYEILKGSGIDIKTLNLIKYHHQNASHTGYPKVPEDFFADINLQILTVADKFSALMEQRVYKAPMKKDQALALIYKDVAKSDVHPFVFKALVNYASKISESSKNLVNTA